MARPHHLDNYRGAEVGCRPPLMNAIADWLTYFIYSTLWQLVRWMPSKVAYGFFDLVSRITYRRDGKRVRRLRENYRRVRPDLSDMRREELVKEGLSNAMRYWCDTFRISDWSREDATSQVTSTNEEILHVGMASKRGVIIAVPHAGNWDHAGYYYCSIGYPVHTVAEHLKPEKLFRKFLEHRAKMGMTVLDLDSQTIPELTRFLNEGKLVALVADRDLSRSGIEVRFFGGIAKMPVGPALLAYKTGADLITAYVGYRNEGIHISWRGPISVDRSNEQNEEISRVTQKIADIFQEEIDADPTSWHMQQRIFIDDQGSRSR